MSEPSGRTTVLIVDRHVLVRQGVRALLEAECDIEIVGEADDTRTAVVLAAERKPDVVLLDIEVSDNDDHAIVRDIRGLVATSAVIILSMFEGVQLLQSLLDAGIRGYLLKNITLQELVSAIRRVLSAPDHVVLSVSRESLRSMHGPVKTTLSPREREILILTAEALSNAQIAAQLCLTEATVKRHLRNIFGKLGAVSRIDAVNRAVTASLIEVGGSQE